MDENDYLLIATLAIGAYVVYNMFSQKPLSPERAESAIVRAGGTSNGSFVTVKELDGTSHTMKINQEWNPNFAQRALIGLDRWVPGSWLTAAVLT